MMSLLLHTLFILFSSTLGSVKEQNLSPIESQVNQYKLAINKAKTTSQCEELKQFTENKNFILHELAILRFHEFCSKQPNWQALSQRVRDPLLQKPLFQSWFQYEQSKKKYLKAYELYFAHKQLIQLDNKEFDELAVQAMQSRGIARSKKRKIQKTLEARSPRFLKRPKQKDYLKVARDFRRDRLFEKALYYYRKVINNPKRSYNDRWQAFKGARMTYKIERWSRMEKYIRASKQWANFLRKKYKWSKAMTRMHHDANIAYIRTLWTERGQNQAKKELLKLEGEIKGRYSLQMVYWLKGRMAEERKNFNEAVQWLSKAGQQRSLSARNTERVLWSLAWNQRRVEDYKGSNITISRLLKGEEMTFFAKTKYLYWKAENLASMTKKNQAKQAFQKLAELDSYGFYGALAYRWLKTPFPKPPKFIVENPNIFNFFNAKEKRLYQALIHLEEFDLAKELILTRVEKKQSWSSNSWANYLSLLQHANAYKEFFKQYHRLQPKHQLMIQKDYPHLLFPQAYQADVEKAAKMTRVSSALIYSIMKQESGFDMKARSHADAFGLLQLLPKVAKRAAKTLPGIHYSRPEDLYNPDVIIPLGASTLQSLFQRFDSSFILAVASYNASEKAVKGWVKSRFQGDPVRFIEDIPYEETKGYVKLVMRNYITYNRMIGASQSEAFYFPESCLEGLQSFKK